MDHGDHVLRKQLAQRSRGRLDVRGIDRFAGLPDALLLISKGEVVDELDAALATLAEADEHTTFDVQVQRGTQWVDFTFTLD